MDNTGYKESDKRGNTDENHLIAIVCNAMIINYHKNGCNTNL